MNRFRRLATAMWRQEARTLRCPDAPRLDGRRALVTGGNAGIGLATCAGLLARGAEVVMAARNPTKAAAACAALLRAAPAGAALEHVTLDLADLRSVHACAQALAERHAPLDIAICNAGIWPRRYESSPQGHELAFATNVLGHFALLRQLIAANALRPDARVVVVTGDIYVMARECTPDYRFSGPLGGMQAYCRSKLGDIWIAHELQRRHPGLHVAIAHPGVVASDLGGAPAPRFDRIRRRLMLPIELGAQTPLFCATQPLAKGVYVHNTLGELPLEGDDPGADRAAAERLWDVCTELCNEYAAAA
jgi:NAD(P)-dependent dehydrogenase (short-subunit alcohol dehydrogenase family)